MPDSVAPAQALAGTGRRMLLAWHRRLPLLARLGAGALLFLLHYPRFKDACLVDKGREQKTMPAPSFAGLNFGHRRALL